MSQNSTPPICYSCVDIANFSLSATLNNTLMYNSIGNGTLFPNPTVISGPANWISWWGGGSGGYSSNVFSNIGPNPISPNSYCLFNYPAVPGFGNTGYSVISGSIDPTYVATCNAGPPSFNPNMIVNCCDPTETYQLDPIYSFSHVVMDTITGTGVNQIGVNNFTEAFRADLWKLNTTTGYKCWHLKEQHPPFGPSVLAITIAPVQKYPDCGHLNHHITSSFNPPYKPCCPPPPDECDSNIMAYLQDKVTDFKIIKDEVLNP